VAPRQIFRPVEIRFHPRGGHGRVRRLPLGARRLRAALAILVAYVALVLAGVALAPAGVGGWLRRSEYGVQVARRQQLGERLQSLVDRLGRLRGEGAVLLARLERIQDAYQLPEEAEAFAGGAEGEGVAAPEASIFEATAAHGGRLSRELAVDLARIEARLARIAAFERADPARARRTPARTPLAAGEFVLTSGFGRRRSPYTRDLEFHSGLDLAAPPGSAVLAAADGVVTFASLVQADGRSDWWRLGRLVAIRHGDRFVTLYGHCDKLLVRDGQRVRGGDRIATVGTSGWTTGPQLHYEVRRPGAKGAWLPVDPTWHLIDEEGAWIDVGRSVAGARGAAPSEATPLPATFLR
jgi:murein DD-endopeptidase MepM/ murein hydrolase activator NlpD